LTLHTGPVDLEVPQGRLVTPDGGEREWHSQLSEVIQPAGFAPPPCSHPYSPLSCEHRI
jgi:hypothetical protein